MQRLVKLLLSLSTGNTNCDKAKTREYNALYTDLCMFSLNKENLGNEGKR